MKPSFLLIILWILIKAHSFAQVPPRSGWLKVSIENVKCINKSYDGVVEFDGHGNEISVTYSYRIYKASNPSAAKRGADGTVIYGSNVNGMTRAGTQTPDLGGITKGDVVNIFKPIINERIDADDIVIIAPNVWEWDNPQKTRLTAYNGQLDIDLDWMVKQPYVFENVPVTYGYFPPQIESRVFKIFDKYKKYGEAFKYEGAFPPATVREQQNQVIGLSTGSWFGQFRMGYCPPVVVLDTRILMGLVNHNSNANSLNRESQTTRVDGVSIIFKDKLYSDELDGHYSVFLRIEFTPDKDDPITKLPIQPQNAIINTVPKSSGGNLNTNGLLITGVWKGTYGYGSSNTPNYFSFQFNTDGTMLVLDASGRSMGSGTYSFLNNKLNGSFKYNGNNNAFTISATLNGNQLEGTWNLNTTQNGNGRWVMTKQ